MHADRANTSPEKTREKIKSTIDNIRLHTMSSETQGFCLPSANDKNEN